MLANPRLVLLSVLQSLLPALFNGVPNAAGIFYSAHVFEVIVFVVGRPIHCGKEGGLIVCGLAIGAAIEAFGQDLSLLKGEKWAGWSRVVGGGWWKWVVEVTQDINGLVKLRTCNSFIDKRSVCHRSRDLCL